MVRTTRDLERATPVGTIELNTALPQLGLYFILGLVYAVISPFILPFIVVSLGASYVVNRNQVKSTRLFRQHFKFFSGHQHYSFELSFLTIFADIQLV